MLKTVLLLSGGLDSAVNLAVAAAETRILTAITFDYGQRAAAREIASAEAMCRRFGVEHKVVELPWLGEITQTALVDRSQDLPAPDEESLDHGPSAKKTAEAVWVPNRNGVFVAVGAAFTESMGGHAVVAGFNAEEGKTFPDNSLEFLSAQNRLLALSTLARVKVISYTAELDKRGIVELGLAGGAALDLVWSCYADGARHCLKCESCRRLKRALEAAGAWEKLEEKL